MNKIENKHLIKINDYMIRIPGVNTPEGWSFIRETNSGRMIHIILSNMHRSVIKKGKKYKIGQGFEPIHLYIFETKQTSIFNDIVKEIEDGKFATSSYMPETITLTEYIIKGHYLWIPTMKPYHLWYIDSKKRVHDFVIQIAFKEGDKILKKYVPATSNSIKIFLHESEIKIKYGRYIETNPILKLKIKEFEDKITAYQRWIQPTQELPPIEGEVEQSLILD